MAPHTSLAAVGYALLCMVELSSAIVLTETVYKACPTTTTTILPSCGWILTTGTTRPYCFSTPAASRSSSTGVNSQPTTTGSNTISTSSTSSSSISTSSISTSVLPPSYSVPSASTTRSILSVTVTPIPSTSATGSSDTSSSTISTTVLPPPSYSGIPTPTVTSRRATSSTSATVTPLPSSSTPAQTGSSSTSASSQPQPPIYTPPAVSTSTSSTRTSTATLTSSTLITLTTPNSIPGYGEPSITIPPPPPYEFISTTTSSSLPTSTPGSGYCYQDNVLLDVNVNITITDNLGAAYVLLCVSTSLGVSLTGADLATVPAPTSVDDCFPLCDANALCTGFTFQSRDPWGMGPGTCYLKRGSGLAFEASVEANLIAFIKVPLLDLLGKRSDGSEREIRGVES